MSRSRSLAVVQLHEVDDALNHLGLSQGIGIAAPGFQQDGERFLIELRPESLNSAKVVLMQRMRPLKAHMKRRPGRL